MNENPNQQHDQSEVTEVRLGDKDRHVTPGFFTPAPPKDSEPIQNKQEVQTEPPISQAVSYDEPSETVEDGEKTGKKTKFLVALIAVVTVAVLGISVGIKVYQKIQPTQSGEQNSVSSSGDAATVPTQAVTEPSMVPGESIAPEETTVQTVPETTAPAKTVAMLISRYNIIPGHVITPEDFELEEITESEYRKLTVSADLYTEQDMDVLVGMQAKEFIPAGKFINYETIGSYAPANPWATAATENIVVVKIDFTPELLSQFTWGSQVDLVLTVQTKRTDTNTQQPEGDETAQSQEGIEHESSVVESMVIDTYKLQSVAVLDLLNTEQISLFNTYYAVSEIPEPFIVECLRETYTDTQAITEIVPAYVKVRVSAEQAALLASLTDNEMKVAATNAATATQSEYEALVHSAVMSVQKHLAAVWQGE